MPLQSDTHADQFFYTKYIPTTHGGVHDPLRISDEPDIFDENISLDIHESPGLSL